MSKLSRYKKAPAIKLPLPASKKIFQQSNSDDDDFQTPKKASAAGKSNKKKENSQISVSSSKEIKPREDEVLRRSDQLSSNSSSSEYFGEVDIFDNSRDDSNSNEENSPICDPIKSSNVKLAKGIAVSRDKPSCKIKLPILKKNNLKTSSDSGIVSVNNVLPLIATDKFNNCEQADDDVPKIDEDEVVLLKSVEGEKPEALCPFCWKRLNDKLLGATHVKACAKNLPTRQIFEALQLQEKQIKEWEELGIAYPGFQGGGPSTVNGRGGGTSRGNNANRAPRPRKKKQDPNLELAIALSESLHEEVERRKQNENEFIVLNDLQKEIELRPLNVIPQNTALVETVDVTRKPAKRRRKGSLTEFPLYKASESDKKAEIAKRLTLILLDENEMYKDSGEFYVRDNPPISMLHLSHVKNTNVTPISLWSISSCDDPTQKVSKKFVTSAVSECKLNGDAGKAIVITSTPPRNDVPLNECVPNSKSVKVKTRPSKKSEAGLKFSQFPQKIDDTNNSRNSSAQQAQLVSDLLRMFVNKEAVDLTVYGKEEKSIKCHKFIVMARSSKLYSEIVQETNSKGIVRDIISLTCFSHIAVKAFVKYLYCAKLKELEGQDFEDVTELGSRYGIQLPIGFRTPLTVPSVSPIRAPLTVPAVSPIPIRAPLTVSAVSPIPIRAPLTVSAVSPIPIRAPLTVSAVSPIPIRAPLTVPAVSPIPIRAPLTVPAVSPILIQLPIGLNAPLTKTPEDPFENSYGDSCFLNLPSILLQGTPPLTVPAVSPIPATVRSSISSSHNFNAQFLETPPNTKPISRRKDRKQRASSQDPTPTKKLSDPKVALKSKNPNALNYSTIDTPILKKELKRYGLKPLPRSKAKLILRHIDEETSKADN